MKITTVLCATSSVAPEMTLLVTTRVIKMETKPAWKVGWEKSANKVVCFLCLGLTLVSVEQVQTAVGISVVSVL